jgi:hypothetical protein
MIQLGGILALQKSWMMGWLALESVWLPSGKHTKNYGKPPLSMGKIHYKWQFSIAMLVITRGYPKNETWGMEWNGGSAFLHGALSAAPGIFTISSCDAWHLTRKG